MPAAGQLRFEDQPEPPLISLNRERVVSLYTFSKILLPGFRLNFSSSSLEEIDEGIRRLAEVIDEWASKKRDSSVITP